MSVLTTSHSSAFREKGQGGLGCSSPQGLTEAGCSFSMPCGAKALSILGISSCDCLRGVQFGQQPPGSQREEHGGTESPATLP